jgi:hypothetical protein
LVFFRKAIRKTRVSRGRFDLKQSATRMSASLLGLATLAALAVLGEAAMW